MQAALDKLLISPTISVAVKPLIEVEPRRRKKADYKRWERSRSMELWQMDIVGGVQLADGSEGEDRVGDR